MDEIQAYQKNALSLAYVGDAVFSLIVRKYLVENSGLNLNALNKKANSVVCAKNQAELMQKLLLNLNERETEIAMRARNSHTNNKAKNSTFAEYHLATEFEAVIGYWYLTNQKNKIDEFFNNHVKSLLS